jgi:hypothetical protein
MRARSLCLGLMLLGAVTAWAADQVVIEDWSRARGATGVPPEWKGQNWGSPNYNFKVEDSDGRAALHMTSVNDSSTISREIKGRVRVKETPVLEWSWRAVQLPKGGNSCNKDTDDQAAALYVVWPRFPEAVRSRIVGYVWDTTAPVGTTCKSEKTGTVTYVVVRSGPAELGKWLTESRNVADDFRKIYGEAPDDPAVLSIGIDSNDTKSTSESFVGPIQFRRR